MPRNAFPFPLRLHDLDEFTHPLSDNELSRPYRHGQDVQVGNTRIAMRIQRGMWLPSDFQDAAPDVAHRFEKLPWARFATLPDHWSALADAERFLFKNAQIALWNKLGRLSPSPVWRVNEHHFVRLSCLQLIARLPRCEVFNGPSDRSDPVFFRFGGGIGLIPKENALTESSFEICRPRRCGLDGTRLGKSQPRPSFTQSNVNWPPPEPDDS